MNSTDATTGSFQFSLRALIILVAFCCLSANLWLNYRAAFSSPKLYVEVGIEGKRLEIAYEMFREDNSEVIVFPTGLDEQEKLVFLLEGHYNGHNYYDFNKKNLVDRDGDGHFEYQALMPNYTFANINENIVIGNRHTHQTYDAETFLQYDRLSTGNSPLFLSSLVSVLIFLILTWFTLPKSSSKVEVIVLLILLGILAAAIVPAI